MSQALPLSKVKAWVALSRVPFLSVGIFPFILGAIIAWSMGYPMNWAVLLLSSFAVILIMLITYWAGEYYDFEADSINVNYNIFSGGTRVLQAGLIPRHYALVATYLSLSLAVIIGLLLQFYFKTGPYTLLLGAFGLFCGYFYSAKPVQWSHRGVGEVLIAICYGGLTVNAAYYLQTASFHPLATLVSIPLAISIFLVILINEFPDYISDRVSGKRTLVVRFGMKRMALVYLILSMACFLAILGPPLYVGPWIIAPLALLPVLLIDWNIIAVMRKEYEDGKRLQALCGRTILLHLTIASIFMLAFLLEGAIG